MNKIKYLAKIDLIKIAIEALYLNILEESNNNSFNLSLIKSNKLIKNTENSLKYYFVQTITILKLIHKIVENPTMHIVLNKIIKDNTNCNYNELKQQYLNKFKYIYYKNNLYYNNNAYYTSYNLNKIAIINLYIIHKTIEQNTLLYLFTYLLL